MYLRRLIVAIAALLIGAQAVRNAAVTSWAELHPDKAAMLWAAHPRVETTSAMTAIARAARDRKPIDPAVFETMDRAARQAPLAPEPYLVRGVELRVQGHGQEAARSFAAARTRDPRSVAARYFLAEQYLAAADAQAGLREVGALARLAPGGVSSIAPFVAAFASDRSHWPELRRLLAANESLRNAVLVALAQDPRNAAVAMALAGPADLNADSPWAPLLLRRLVETHQYGEARSIWSRLVGAGGGQQSLLFDPQFRRPSALPFTWQLTSSPLGLAEPQAGGRLHLLYYGQDNGPLARQLLMLPSGSYRLVHKLLGGGTHAEALRWSIQCDGGKDPVGAAALPIVAARGLSFTVPAGCPAQWLQLTGQAADLPQQSDASISDLQLIAVGPNG